MEKSPEKKPGGLIDSFTADVIAVGSSIVAGAVTAWSQIESLAYRNMSALDTFEESKPRRKLEREKIEQELKEGLITPRESFHKIDQLIEKNEQDAFRRMEEFGISNIMDRWNILRRHQKLEVMTWAMVASGVAIGSMLQLLRTAEITENTETPEKSGPKR